MRINSHIKYITFFVLTFVCFRTFAQDYKHTIIPKLGAYSINTSNQSTSERSGTSRCLFDGYCNHPEAPVALTIDTDAKKVFSVEYEWHLKYGMTVGGDIVNFDNNYTSSTYNNRSGTIETTVFIGNFKKYFSISNSFQPFIGVGLGIAYAQFSGPLTGNAVGIAAQAKLGAIYKIGRYSIYGEYHYLYANHVNSSHAESEGDISGSVDLTGDGYFLGLAVSF